MKKAKKTSVFLFALILAGCGPFTSIPTPTAKAPIIKFESPNILDRMQQGYDFDLNVGIYAIDKDNLFLFGSIGELENYPLQSALLRSEDGGKHWKEVLKPQRVSRVIEFQMTENGTGWALILQRNEGIGEATLFQSEDFGKSWKILSTIPRDNYLGKPTFMYFGDEKDGQIDIVYPFEMPNEGYIAHLSTFDGGKSWQETGSYSPKFENTQSQSNITFGYWLYEKNHTESISLDNKSYWKLEEYDGQLFIKRSLPKPIDDSTGFIVWDEWEVITVLPITLHYEHGMIESP